MVPKRTQALNNFLKRFSLRGPVLERDGFQCRQCGAMPGPQILQVAHVKPLSNGGSHTIDNLVTLCPNCHERYNREYIASLICENPDTRATFDATLEAIAALNKAQLPGEQAAAALRNLLYANIITALETYLCDTIVSTVMNHPSLVRVSLKEVTELRSQKVSLSEVYERAERAPSDVRDYFLDLVYHNLFKIKPIYRAVLQVEFPDDLTDLVEAIQRRHDIVHRSGKSKSGENIGTTTEAVESLMAIVKDLVDTVHTQVLAKPWAPAPMP